MRKEPIIRSPYAFDVIKHMQLSDKEKEELYSQRVEELAEPYTVIDVITKVYQRTLCDDLSYSFENEPRILQEIKRSSEDWLVSQYWINSFKILRSESVFGQPANDFNVDIYAEVSIKLRECKRDGYGPENIYPLNTKLRLRYSFDLRPCELTCRYTGVVRSNAKLTATSQRKKRSNIKKTDKNICQNNHFLENNTAKPNICV